MPTPKNPDYKKLNACTVDAVANHASPGATVVVEPIGEGDTAGLIATSIPYPTDPRIGESVMGETYGPGGAGKETVINANTNTVAYTTDNYDVLVQDHGPMRKDKFDADGKLTTDAPGVRNPDNYVKMSGDPGTIFSLLNPDNYSLTSPGERATNAMANEVASCVNSDKPAPAPSKPVQYKAPDTAPAASKPVQYKKPTIAP